MDLYPDEPLFRPTAPPSPDAIVEDYSDEYYHICWKPKAAGILHTPPGLVQKKDLAKEYPHVVEAWEAKQRNEQEEASRVEGRFVAFGRKFYNYKSEQSYTEPAQHGAACEHNLQFGMRQHWGELRKCKSHPLDLPVVWICKGCRVSHNTLESRTFDRQLIMTRGARVPACDDCAKMVLDDVAHRNCMCDTLWTCFRCREAELNTLAKARKKHTKDTCGRCLKAATVVQHVDFCLHCKGWRVYEVSKNEMETVENDERTIDGQLDGE